MGYLSPKDTILALRVELLLDCKSWEDKARILSDGTFNHKGLQYCLSECVTNTGTNLVLLALTENFLDGRQ